MPKKLSIKTNFVLIGIVIGLFIGVSIEQVLGEGAGVSGTAQGNTLAVNMSGQYMNGLIVANGNALVLNGKMSIGNIDPIDVLTVTGKAQSNGLCIGTSCITNWDDLKTILGTGGPIGSTHNKLPPTGVTIYADDNTNSANASVATDTGEFPRQDARYARPFDYTKIANDGSILPATATLGTGTKDWACTKDNITGLIWEVKTTSGLRNKDYTYTWYQNGKGTPDDSSNGPFGQTPSRVCQTTGRCDTEKFVEDVKATSLCGYKDWRMPTVKELEQITDFSNYGPSIDRTYFPNTAIASSVTSSYWTSTLNSNSSQYAWIVNSVIGISMVQVDYIPQPIRLVVGSKPQEVYKPSCEESSMSQNNNNPIASNPDNVYDTATVPGTAIDTRNGLMWQRCSEGQTWDGNSGTCVCNAGTTWVGRNEGTNFYCKRTSTYPLGEYSWSGVLKKSVSNNFAGFTDWRVPNVKELRSLVEEGCDNPSINGTIFPHTYIDVYWTSSPDVTAYLAPPNHSLVVTFNYGAINWVTRFSGSQIRLVRDIKETPNNIVCAGTVPITGTIKSSVTPTTSTPWSYNTSGAACTYMCDSTHSWDGSSCTAQVAKKLPPTGITSYADLRSIGVDASVAADTGEFPRQDARYARPFDYTKIANDGTTLPATATLGTGAKDWACTKDNITGLIWEVKTTSGLRSKDNTYTWYNSDSNTNGGDVGFTSGVWYNSGTATAPGCNTTGRCDTEKFVADVNGVGLCGHSSNWRLPTVKELEGIANFELTRYVTTLDQEGHPAIDTNYFPNTPGRYFFTNTLDSVSYLYAWIVDGYSGAAVSQVRNVPLPVRLVWTGSPAPSVHNASCNDTNPIASNPDNVYNTTTVPGTAIDTRTGLMWQRCIVGQTWNGSTCIGSAQGGNWAWVLQQSVSNKFAGFTDWRVPNVKELRSLVEECRANPPINGTIFPNTPGEVYYTSSFNRMAPGIASFSWSVVFDKGTENYSERYIGSYVRLVRDITP